MVAINNCYIINIITVIKIYFHDQLVIADFNGVREKERERDKDLDLF